MSFTADLIGQCVKDQHGHRYSVYDLAFEHGTGKKLVVIGNRLNTYVVGLDIFNKNFLLVGREGQEKRGRE